jgi:hypothetical protein
VPETGRFCYNVDCYGRRHDYGYLHFNLYALACGIGTPEQRRAVLSWLDGRAVPGDTATGPDIYHWRFAPRTSTRRNLIHYFWPWKGDAFAFGYQMQDGGAVPFTTFLETAARVASGDQGQVDRAYERSRQVMDWYADVAAAGGDGPSFYRAYYDGHPERGTQQGGGPPGGLGLDREFLSDAGLGTLFPLAFLGLRAEQDGVLDLAPALPSALTRLGVTNVFYRGSYLTVEAGRRSLRLSGSIPAAAGLRVRVTFRGTPPGARLMVDGRPCAEARRDAAGALALVTALRPLRVELVAP